MALPKDLAREVADAKVDRSRHQEQINTFLRMADPTRPRIGDSDVAGANDRNAEADDRFDTTLEEVAEDFASDLIGRVIPRERNWLEYEPEEGLPDEVMAVIAEELEVRTQKIFSAIRGSDFYDEAAGEWALDQGHGTSAIYVADPGAGQRFHCEAIPPGQLLIGRGMGGVTFRAREVRWQIDECVSYWPNYDWTEKHRRMARQDSTKRNRVKVLMAASRIPDPGGEQWKWRVAVDDDVVHQEEVEGRGSCPILVTRWRTHSSSAWGIGPLRKSTPNARILDQLNYLMLKNLGKVVDPVVSYEDDNIMDPDAGVVAGTWMPRMPGSRAPETIGTDGRMDVAYFEEAGLQDAIRRAGYQSGPRQRGKTPPTLGQWTDEKAEEGRRLEMPTGKLYAEGVIALVERFEYLLVKAGQIAPMVVAKDKAVKVRPQNPLSRQQDYEEVTAANQLLQGGNAAFTPQVMAAQVDVSKTLKNMQKKMNDKIVVFREAAEADPLLRSVLGGEAQDPAAGGEPGMDPQAAPMEGM